MKFRVWHCQGPAAWQNHQRKRAASKWSAIVFHAALVTPTSQIVGVQAVLNVLFGRYEMVSGQVKDYVFGLYGKPPREIDPEVTSKVLKDYDRGQNPVSGRAADYLEPEMEQAIEDIKHIY